MERGPQHLLDSLLYSHIVKPVIHHLSSPIPQKIHGNVGIDLLCLSCEKGLTEVSFPSVSCREIQPAIWGAAWRRCLRKD